MISFFLGLIVGVYITLLIVMYFKIKVLSSQAVVLIETINIIKEEAKQPQIKNDYFSCLLKRDGLVDIVMYDYDIFVPPPDEGSN